MLTRSLGSGFAVVLAFVGIVVATVLLMPTLMADSTVTPGGGSKTDCAYTANNISTLQSFERLVGRPFSCAVVFDNAAPNWAAWEKPWFLTPGRPTTDWAAWATTPGTHRQLVITNGLFPSDLNHSDWLQAGAAGLYASHARALARNLVAAGLGSSVIRLAHEANGTQDPYALPTTNRGLALWRQFWRRTVIAMRSVPGAHFLFDWTVNAYWRPIALNKWYPGDDVVDIVGIDSYDAGVPVGQKRWTRLYDQPNGIGDVLTWALVHHKPLSFPEWGLSPPGPQSLGGGNDPGYIDHMAAVVRNYPVAYQSYFFGGDEGALLFGSPSSLATYRRHFGGRGDSFHAATISRRLS